MNQEPPRKPESAPTRKESRETDAPILENQREAEKRKPVFRFARLDGRDTLKYEDTADK
jgi:hypothetical protein